MKRIGVVRSLALATVLGVLIVAPPARAQSPRSEILIAAERVFPQGLAAGPDGEVYISSLGAPVIYRAAPGQRLAQRWIRLDGPGTVYAVGLAVDPAAAALWACVVRETAGDGVKVRQSALAAFDLTSGKPKAVYPLPDGHSVCHDVAVSGDGSVYVTDPAVGRVLRLRRGGAVLEPWLRDVSLDDVSGAAFVGDDLFLCTSPGRLFRVIIDARGAPLGRIEMIPSRPLDRPDGLRAQGVSLYVAESGAGRVSELVLSGQRARVRALAEGLMAPTALAPVAGAIWVVESKLAYRRDPAIDAGDFKAYAIPLN